MKHKSIIRRLVLGFLNGVGMVVPGISGSTMTIIFGLYDDFIHVISHLFQEFKKAIRFLIPITLGMVAGALVGYFLVAKLLDNFPFAVSATFAGLMLGGIPSLADQVRDTKLNEKYILLLVIGFIVPIAVAFISICVESTTLKELKFDFKSILVYMLIGAIFAITSFIPGGSASAMLICMGYYSSLLDALDINALAKNPSTIWVFVIIIIVALGSSFGFSVLIEKLINRFKVPMYFLFIGLSLGSVVCIFYNIEMVEVYKAWGQGKNFALGDILSGVGLFILSVIASYILVKWQRKIMKQREEKQRLEEVGAKETNIDLFNYHEFVDEKSNELMNNDDKLTEEKTEIVNKDNT